LADEHDYVHESAGSVLEDVRDASHGCAVQVRMPTTGTAFDTDLPVPVLVAGSVRVQSPQYTGRVGLGYLGASFAAREVFSVPR
jgi:hypothetical protein